MWRDYELSRGNTSVVFLWKTRSHKLSTSSSHTQDAVVATDHNAVPCTITIFLVFIPSRSAGGLIIPLGLAPWLAHINLSWPHSSETGHICYCEWQSWNLSLPPPPLSGWGTCHDEFMYLVLHADKGLVLCRNTGRLLTRSLSVRRWVRLESVPSCLCGAAFGCMNSAGQTVCVYVGYSLSPPSDSCSYSVCLTSLH